MSKIQFDARVVQVGDANGQPSIVLERGNDIIEISGVRRNDLSAIDGNPLRRVRVTIDFGREVAGK